MTDPGPSKLQKHPPPGARSGTEPDGTRPIDRLLGVMARLRDPRDGCPWDLEQTFETILPHTLEEAYEVADAIVRGDRTALKDELGDLLFQIVYYAQMSREEGGFGFDDIAAAVADKMVRRHPHVFGEADTPSSRAQTTAWEDLKARERAAHGGPRSAAPPSALDGVALALPALVRALKLQKRAARVGFDWGETAPVFAKIEEEIAELKAAMDRGTTRDCEEELGDLLFAVVNLARHLSVDAEAALRRGNEKFARRFRAVEARLAAAGRTATAATLDEMDRLWNEVKLSERG